MQRNRKGRVKSWETTKDSWSPVEDGECKRGGRGLEQLGGNRLATFPIRLREIRFVPDKTTATTGEHAIHIKALYSHYPVEQTIVNGDVNGDGRVNVSDVSALINMILGLETMNQPQADVNGDGRVNVSDVTALINLILGIS